MIVELDVFSGRPNPRWELGEAARHQLQKLLTRLAPAGAAPDPPALGYRGFCWNDASGAYRAFGGYLRTPRTTFDDPSVSIEQFLLEQLPPEFEFLRARIFGELARRRRGPRSPDPGS